MTFRMSSQRPVELHLELALASPTTGTIHSGGDGGGGGGGGGEVWFLASSDSSLMLGGRLPVQME